MSIACAFELFGTVWLGQHTSVAMLEAALEAEKVFYPGKARLLLRSLSPVLCVEKRGIELVETTSAALGLTCGNTSHYRSHMSPFPPEVMYPKAAELGMVPCQAETSFLLSLSMREKSLRDGGVRVAIETVVQNVRGVNAAHLMYGSCPQVYADLGTPPEIGSNRSVPVADFLNQRWLFMLLV